jgi:alkyl sulfatase BDS1-like metallo-beta-lactamase superfamily hydrolase
MKIATIFDKVKPFLATQGAEAVKKVGYVYFMEVAPAKGKPATTWTIDLKNGNGSIKEGKEGKADATFTILDNDAADLFSGKLNPQTAFMQGKLKIKGNMQAALKFTPDIFPKGSL